MQFLFKVSHNYLVLYFLFFIQLQFVFFFANESFTLNYKFYFARTISNDHRIEKFSEIIIPAHSITKF